MYCISLFKFLLSNLQSRHWAVTSLTSLRHILDESFNVAFVNRNENQLATVPTHVKQKLKNLHLALTDAADDREASSIAAEFDKEFDLDNFSTPRLIQPFAAKLIRWIKSFEMRVSSLSKNDCLVDVSQYLSSFQSRSVVCDMPTEIFSAKQPLHFRLKIFKYLPDVQSVSRGSWSCRRIFIRALNGKKYAFLIVPLGDAGPCLIHQLSRFVQLLHACNSIMSRNKECASRLLKFEVPSFVPISSNAILLSDDGCCLTFLDVLKEILKDQNMNPDDVIMRYFDKLTVHQSRTGRITDQNLKDIFKDILHTVVSKNSLSNYFGRLYPNAESYFTIRRQIGLNVGLINLAGHCFNLTPLKPNVLMFDKDHGSVSTTFVRFSLNETKPDSSEHEICAFRVTPCLAEFLGLSLCGHMIPAMLAAARALSQSYLHHYLRLLIFNDHHDFASICKQENIESSVSDPVNVAENAVDAFINRLQGLSQLDNAENMPLLEAVSNYQNHDYLCKMDPAWHPWF
uniref:PI3K/PI4K catalytic domain-containing protein n=1 Tax=Romanomermis culicivorax TaxID=13658 RepID=A0A915ILI9_ROMCU